MEAYIDTIESAKINPFNDSLNAELKSLIQTLSKLKSFVQFLMDLPLTKYRQWMDKACSLYKAGSIEGTKEIELPKQNQLIPSRDEIEDSFTSEPVEEKRSRRNRRKLLR